MQSFFAAKGLPSFKADIALLFALCVFAFEGVAQSEKVVLIPREGREHELRWEDVKADYGYEVEFSQSPAFPSGRTIYGETDDNFFWVNVKKEGTYYWRVRSEDSEADDYLVTKKIEFRRSKKMPAPRINWLGRWAGENSNYPKMMKWSKVKRAKKYVIDVFDPKKRKKAFSVVTEDTEYEFDEFKKLDPGYYVVRMAGIDRFGWEGRSSPCRWTYVGKRSEIGKPPNSVQRAALCSNRSPASFNSLEDPGTTLIEGNFFENVGVIYNIGAFDSHLVLEGASFALKSIAANNTNQGLALAGQAAVRGLFWLGAHGFEASYKSVVVGYNDLGKTVGPKAWEARYHLRLRTRFPWIGWMPGSQISIFAGYESYQNEISSNSLFVQEYNVLKAGTSLKFRLFDRWETGGEVAYGRSGDGDQKIEMQGYLSYYLNRNWSLGTGYRVHLIDVGSVVKSPDGKLPYREGYGEAFGSMRYSF